MPSLRSTNWDGVFIRSFLLIAGFALFATGVAAAQVVPGPDDAALQTLLGGDDQGLSGTVVQLFLFVTVLSLVPGIAMMVTCLPFMVIVFSILRQALGVQQAPPNMMIMALAMFLTFFIMEPVFMEAWASGLSPYIDGTIDEQQAWLQTTEPFREFMMRRTDPDTLFMLSDALNRLCDLHAVHGDRSGRRLRAHGGRDDDGSANRSVTAVQTRLLRSRRRVAENYRSLDQGICLSVEFAKPSRHSGQHDAAHHAVTARSCGHCHAW